MTDLPPEERHEPDDARPSEEDMLHQIVPRRLPDPDEEEAEEGDLPQFVSVLTPVEQQVGLHVLGALQHPETVAVLTMIAGGGDGQQRVVSVGLNPERLAQVQQLLMEESEDRKKRVPCIGFHCRLEDKAAEEDEGA
jgi:hypothetical protein